MKKYLQYILILYISINIVACSSDNVVYDDYLSQVAVNNTDSTELNISANKWILRMMKLYYYWADSIPSNMESKYKLSPHLFFGELLHSQDHFSWISNTKSLNDEKIYGSIKNNGFECVFFTDSTQFNLLGEVIYTYPGSDAEAHGIKRGMFFKKINETQINMSNYKELLNKEEAYYQFLSINKNIIDTINCTILQKNTHLNPILCSKIITLKKRKIGYLCYRQFINDNNDGSDTYKKELIQLISSFQKQNISDIVLDLRYNTGGDINLSVLLGSMLVPKDAKNKVALKIKYNEKLTKAYSSIGSNLVLHFKCNDDCYIGDIIDNIIILTGPNTASASEDLINMLLPYKKPIIIGTCTYGKNYGSQIFKSVNENIPWVLQPITMKIFNSADSSNFDKGFEPDYEVNELNFQMKMFGALDEPLMQKAIEVILKTSNIKKTKNIISNNLQYKLWKYNIEIQKETVK